MNIKFNLYFTSITQKAHRTYIRVLEGADFANVVSLVDETWEHVENHRVWMGDYLPVKCTDPDLKLDCS